MLGDRPLRRCERRGGEGRGGEGEGEGGGREGGGRGEGRERVEKRGRGEREEKGDAHRGYGKLLLEHIILMLQLEDAPMECMHLTLVIREGEPRAMIPKGGGSMHLIHLDDTSLFRVHRVHHELGCCSFL